MGREKILLDTDIGTEVDDAITPVSYTHLDVYKRQDCRRGID